MALLAGEEALLGVGTIAITYTLGITVLDPLGDFVGSYVVNIFLWSSEHMGPIVVGILAGCILHNMAEDGACLRVALRAKNKALKAETFSLAFGCIVAGVTEPAIYGVNLPLKKPMIGVVAGAASGGVVAGLMGATAYVYGYSTILAIPIFQQTIMAIVVAIAVSAVVTFILGFDESEINR